MKICITYTKEERERASAVIAAIGKLFYSYSQKTTPEKDGYFHSYLAIKEPKPGKAVVNTGTI